MASNQPIGFLDSGVGGLSVLNAARRLFPNEDFILFGDSANVPYGTKTEAEVQALVRAASRRLLDEGIKALVIACNTATAIAENMLKNELSIPVCGIMPPLDIARSLCQSGKVLVMATPGTCKSARFLEQMAPYQDQMISLPCPGLMEFVERGELKGEKLNAHLKQLLAPHLNTRIDVVILGCTHYPFLKESIQPFFANARLIDGSSKTLDCLANALSDQDLLCEYQSKGTTRLLTSGGDEVLSTMRLLLQE